MDRRDLEAAREQLERAQEDLDFSDSLSRLSEAASAQAAAILALARTFLAVAPAILAMAEAVQQETEAEAAPEATRRPRVGVRNPPGAVTPEPAQDDFLCRCGHTLGDHYTVDKKALAVGVAKALSCRVRACPCSLFELEP